MDPRHSSVTPGNDSGSGRRGRGSGSGSGSGRRSRGSDRSGDGSEDSSSRTRRSRLSAQSTGTRRMLAFDDAAGDGDGRILGSSSSSPSGGLDLGLEEFRRVQHEASRNPNLQRLLFHSSPVRQPTQDDEVIVMDGVLVDTTSGSGASGRYGLNRQFFDGKGDPRVVRPIKRTSYEMEPQIRRPAQGPGFYMQRPPTPPPTPRGFPPPLPPPGAGAPRGGSATPAMIPGHPGAFYPFPPPSLPGVGPPRGGGAIPGLPAGFPFLLRPPPPLPVPGVICRPPPSPPYFAPPPRATPTVSLAGPPPGFNPKRGLIRRGEAITLPESERPTPPPPPPPLPPTPVAQHKRTEFSWPPKTTAPAVTLLTRAPPLSSAPKQHPESEAPPLAPSSAPSPREEFAWPLTDEEDELIINVLYGPTNRRRLPVFRRICPD
uniref:Uncharacterized protein n=1 Tax=Oryza meridionalis TaxID=40149 RepID=A0A0E0D1F1_9ORYZ